MKSPRNCLLPFISLFFKTWDLNHKILRINLILKKSNRPRFSTLFDDDIGNYYTLPLYHCDYMQRGGCKHFNVMENLQCNQLIAELQKNRFATVRLLDNLLEIFIMVSFLLSTNKSWSNFLTMRQARKKRSFVHSTTAELGNILV